MLYKIILKLDSFIPLILFFNCGARTRKIKNDFMNRWLYINIDYE